MRKGILRYVIISSFAVASIYFAGCAEIQPPTPKEILKHPFGTTNLRIGMPKEQILAAWGEPDLKEYDETGKWGKAKERWTYHGRYKNLPADVGYLSKTKYLYFDENILIKFEGEE